MIISLTSFPARIPHIGECLRSLVGQCEPDDRLILWLGEEKFPHGLADVPESVAAFSRERGGTVEFRFVHDVRSFTKLIPALLEFPDEAVITADDDIVYRPGTIALLKAAHRRIPDAIFAHAVSDVYRLRGVWKRTTGAFGFRSSPRHLRMPLGVGGVLYPPRCLHPLVTDEATYLKLCPTTDDVWFWYCAVKRGTPVLRAPGAIRRQGWSSAGAVDALSAVNESDGDRVNRENIRRLMEYDPAFADTLTAIADRNRIRTFLSLVGRWLVHYPRQAVFCIRTGGWELLRDQIRRV